MSRGRFREFYQCDFDIAGTYDLMMPDAEAVAVMCEILAALGLNFEVKLNHRSLLDAIMAVCDVPPEKFRTICSAIDKLDKEPWAVVREEMLEKGLEASSADRLEVGRVARHAATFPSLIAGHRVTLRCGGNLARSCRSCNRWTRSRSRRARR